MCLSDCLKLFITNVIFVLFAITSSQSWVSDGMICVQTGPCICTTENGGIVDLAPLSFDFEPLVVSSRTYLYAYHPCNDIRLPSIVKNDCEKSYGICYFKANQTNSKPIELMDFIANRTFGTFQRLALNEEGVFRNNEFNKVEIVYKNINNNKVVTTTVKLECDEQVHNYNLMVEKQEELQHVLRLKSAVLCEKFHHRMSGTAVFFLVLFILLAVYFIGGILVLKFIRGANGVEMIPNHEFWCSIPTIIKDSFTYLKSLCQGTGNQPGTYESI